MTWSNSALFTPFITNPLFATVSGATKPTGFVSLTADAVKVALYNATGTPNKDDTLANTGYNTGQWVTANEVTDATNWVAGGRSLAAAALSAGSGFNQYTGTNLAGGGNVTLTNVFGCLVYDSTISGGTVAKQGICFNYFGGAQSLTASTFTIVWNASGIFRVTN